MLNGYKLLTINFLNTTLGSAVRMYESLFLYSEDGNNKHILNFR